MKLDRKSRRGTLALVAAAIAGTASISAQDLAPINVRTFDGAFTNWATAQEARFDFPRADVSIQRIVMTIRLDCPPGGCDPWDRSASVFVRGWNPAGEAEQFEIARFITPYGVGCSWEVDVTDYRIFLAGSVSLGFFVDTFIGGNRGWLVTLSFDFYPGRAQREVISVENLWRGKPEFGNPAGPIDQFFTPRTVAIDPSPTAVKLRFLVTGHGQGNTDNAAEFARKLHRVRANADSFEHYLWRDDCDRNPCSPQAGTWQFARAGWCPGRDVAPWDIDISDSIVPGETATIRYEVEPYTNRCRPSASCTAADCGDCNFNSNGHTVPIYWVESQAITYGSNVGGSSVFAFQQGLDGYTGTADTMLLEASPAVDRAAATELLVDGDAGGGQAVQALIRFDGVFGIGPGQIPAGTAIRSARLELSTTDAGDGAAAYRLRAPWSDTATWATFGGDGIQVGAETLSEPDGSASATGGGMVAIDVTAAVAAWAESACPYFGWALIPTGSNGWAFSSSEGDEPPRLIIQTRALVDDLLIVAGDEWRYFKGTQKPPEAWNQRDFVPGAGWLSGATGIGYEDDDDVTVLADMRGSYPSVFCRREFQVGPGVTALRLRINYDDGFAAYLNGKEVARSASLAAPGAPLAWNMLARSGREAEAPEVYELTTAGLVPGINVLAIQIHNAALDSSDLSLIPELLADHVLVAPGAGWRFLRGSAPLPADWKESSFDDSGWEEGATGIGYGDGDDVTDLLDMRDSYGAVFCRKEFNLDRQAPLALRVTYDDGIVVFVNGTEVERLNMPPGPVSANLLARSAVESVLATVPIPLELLIVGRNAIAVSVHNAALNSSDLSFDPVVFAPRSTGVSDCSAVFRRGDCNDDGGVDLSDAVFVLGALFLGRIEPPCDDSCDSNDDGAVNISDAIMTLGALFLGQGPIPLPGVSSCGVDPTVDALDCDGAAPCS